MAKKAARTTSKRVKASKVKKARVKKTKVKKTKTKKAKARRKPKAKSLGLGQRLSNAYHAVVDTVTGTGALRDKLEKPGTSESE